MIIGCPSCHRAFRLDDGRFRAGATMRCTRCGHLFASGDPQPPRDSRPPSGAVAGGGRLAILADAGRPFRQRALPLLERLGYHVRTVDEGTEAFRAAVSGKPALMVVSVHLAGLSGVAICEGVKGSPHLREIKIALVGSELSADLFNGDTARAYGADLFLDERMSEEELRTAVGALMEPAGAGDGPGDDLDESIATLTSEDGPRGNPAEEIARLARIMLSDLRLYNPDRFAVALREGRLLETFRNELARGRDLIDHRFPEVRGRQDLLAAALEEGVAKETASGT